MSMLESLGIRLHFLLKGRYAKRKLPARGRKPKIGTPVVHAREGLRLLAQAGMSDELWNWMMEQGWRVESFKPDRRNYKDIPASYVTKLIDSDPERREKLIQEAIRNARSRADLVRMQYLADKEKEKHR